VLDDLGGQVLSQRLQAVAGQVFLNVQHDSLFSLSLDDCSISTANAHT
jgi:hypothetical protein